MSGGGRGGGGGGLGLTLQQLGSESFLFPCRRRMMMVRPNHDRPFEGGGGGSGGDGHGGPTTGSGGAEEVVRCMSGNIYDVAGGSVDGGTVVVRTTPLQQPFDVSTTSTTSTTTTTTRTFKSPGGAGAGAAAAAGGMAASALGFPFTPAQWKELERQAVIYKYMMASVPVPPELLIPISRNFYDPAAAAASSPHSSCMGRGSIFNLRFSNGGDPEPGRCRRTDGKKWRCSRDVAPNQKYCERHMHRGRPRSRKPVEVHTDVNTSGHKKTRHCHALPPATPANLSNPIPPCSQSRCLGSALDPYHQTPVFLYKSDPKAHPFPPLVSVPSSFKETRGLEWTAKGGAAAMAASDQQWQQLMQTKIGLTLESSSSICNSGPSVFNQQYQAEPINLNQYTDLGAGAGAGAVTGAVHSGRATSNMFLNPEAVSLQKPHAETPRAFLDAWSSAVTENPSNTYNKSSVSNDGKLPLSSLTLSMGGGNGIEDEMNQNEMGCPRIADDVGCGGEKPQLSTWLTPASWAVSAPGGPLAEVLRPSSASAAAPSKPTSPHGGNGDSVSPSGTAGSSPSGVLQKPLVSPSDSSGNSSPTDLSVSQVKTEITFPWLNQSKVATAE